MSPFYGRHPPGIFWPLILRFSGDCLSIGLIWSSVFASGRGSSWHAQGSILPFLERGRFYAGYRKALWQIAVNLPQKADRWIIIYPLRGKRGTWTKWRAYKGISSTHTPFLLAITRSDQHGHSAIGSANLYPIEVTAFQGNGILCFIINSVSGNRSISLRKYWLWRYRQKSR